MSVDVSKIKAGDEVTVRGVIYALRGDGRYADGDLAVEFPCTPGGTYHQGRQYGPVSPSAILSHTPKGFAVGDRVKIRGTWPGEIIAMRADRAWVLRDDEHSPVTSPISDLDRL